jgi:hypothetical protein
MSRLSAGRCSRWSSLHRTSFFSVLATLYEARERSFAQRYPQLYAKLRKDQENCPDHDQLAREQDHAERDVAKRIEEERKVETSVSASSSL